MDLIFMGLINYLTDSYGVYSASAMASSIFSRNIAAALLLPLASYDMYTRIGIDWSCSILGFLCLGMSIVPFAFIKYGPSMRERSYFCKKIREQSLLGENVGIDL